MRSLSRIFETTHPVPTLKFGWLMHLCGTDHARLKEHVASMEGGLEAKIHEGGEFGTFHPSRFASAVYFSSHHHLRRILGYLHIRLMCHATSKMTSAHILRAHCHMRPLDSISPLKKVPA